jgi:hypothetical protein
MTLGFQGLGTNPKFALLCDDIPGSTCTPENYNVFVCTYGGMIAGVMWRLSQSGALAVPCSPDHMTERDTWLLFCGQKAHLAHKRTFFALMGDASRTPAQQEAGEIEASVPPAASKAPRQPRAAPPPSTSPAEATLRPKAKKKTLAWGEETRQEQPT